MKKLICLVQAVGLFAFSLSGQPQPAPQANVPRPGVPPSATLPAWPKPIHFESQPGLPSVRSGDVEVQHATNAFGGFIVRVNGQTSAFGSLPERAGYLLDGNVRWLDCASQASARQSVAGEPNGIRVSCECTDEDGAAWQIKRRFRTGSIPGAIVVETEVIVDRDREVIFLPLLLLFPGAGTNSGSKGQALFAGLEFLEDEPSSSEADVVGPASRRQIPDNLKITFPLMAIQDAGHYIALSWQMRPYLSAVFDSPDRLFQSGGHVMGLLFPGSEARQREEGRVLPRVAELVRAHQTIALRASILGGVGSTVVPAIRQYCALRPLPDLPTAPSLPDYVSLAAAGWLDSRIRETNLVRHALAGDSFKPQPAADAALWLEWLAAKDTVAARTERLRETQTNLLSAVPPERLNSAGVGHIRYPVEALVFGHVADNADRAEQAGRSLVSGFAADGSVRYHAAAGALDYGRTHWTNEASGLASRVVLDLLEAAAFSGNRELLRSAELRLRDLGRFHNGVPRGAQTWECPLHTPDILASAQMVRAYTLGYELTGDERFRDEAIYWAWTGVPFVYLVAPTEHPVGLYSTIAVYGATQWKAPVWFGLPVQWCGLVYADALASLARYDPAGPWKRLADGITISGLQQTWTSDAPQFQGLLPDSFALREQKRNGPAINPATVEACAARYFDSNPVYDFHCFRENQVLVHAPGEIQATRESTRHVEFKVHGWPSRPYYVLVTGVTRPPRVRIDGQPVTDSAAREYLEQSGRLVLTLHDTASVELEL